MLQIVFSPGRRTVDQDGISRPESHNRRGRLLFLWLLPIVFLLSYGFVLYLVLGGLSRDPLIVLHLGDLLLQRKVIVHVVLHLSLVEKREQVMHKGYQSVPSVHQAGYALVTHSHSLVLLVNEILLILIQAGVHACRYNDAFIYVYSREK